MKICTYTVIYHNTTFCALNSTRPSKVRFLFSSYHLKLILVIYLLLFQNGICKVQNNIFTLFSHQGSLNTPFKYFHQQTSNQKIQYRCNTSWSKRIGDRLHQIALTIYIFLVSHVVQLLNYIKIKGDRERNKKKEDFCQPIMSKSKFC